MNDRRIQLVAFLTVLMTFLWLVGHFWWTCDDAFISFRYVKHLTRGDGLIFNPGEAPPVEGFSNLLWILLLSLPYSFGISLPVAANVLSALAGVVLIGLVARFAVVRLESGLAGALATSLFLATLPPFVIWSTSGLESMPFALAVFATYSALVLHPEKPRLLLASICAICAALLRADGALWCGVAFLAALLPWYWKGRWPLLRGVLITGVILSVVVALHFLWRHDYYGEWMPNTARVKAGYSSLRGERGLNYLLSFLLAVPSIALVIVWVSIGSVRKGTRSMVVPSALLFVLINCGYAIYVGGDFMAMGRFFIPSLPFVALLFAAACRGIGHPALIAAFAGANVGLGLAGCLDLLPVSEDLRQRFHFRWNGPQARSEIAQWEFMDAQAKLWSDLGRALSIHTEPGESLIRGNIGATGFHSELVLLDQNGLVIPEVAGSSQPLKKASPGHDRRVDPEFFFSWGPTYLGASLSPVQAPPGAGYGVQTLRYLRSGEVIQERWPLPEEAGFPEGSELRLLRLRQP